MWSLHGIGEWKFVQMVYVTWPVWPPCPYMVKTLKNLLLWNQKANDLESWYAASGTRVLPNLFKWWPWVDLDLFYGKVKFDPFCMGKKVKLELSEDLTTAPQYCYLRRKTYHELKIRETEKNEHWEKEKWRNKGTNKQQQPDSGTHNTSAHSPRVYQVSTFKAS